MRVFISYSRANKAIAARLASDLSRAGIEPWQDVLSIPSDSLWFDELMKGIAICDEFILIASPESARSVNVGKEVAEARRLGKRVLALWISGQESSLPPEWHLREMIPARPYWDALPRLFRDLGHQPPPVPLDLYHPGDTLASFGEKVGGAMTMGKFLAVPVMPGPYASGYLAGPPDLPLPDARRDTLTVTLLLRFTGKVEDDTLEEVVRFEETEGNSPFVFYVEGPQSTGPGNERRFDLPNEPHVWSECVELVDAFVRRWIKGRFSPMRIFLHAPNSLCFAAGARFREMLPYSVYQYARGAQPLYMKIYQVDTPR